MVVARRSLIGCRHSAVDSWFRDDCLWWLHAFWPGLDIRSLGQITAIQGDAEFIVADFYRRVSRRTCICPMAGSGMYNKKRPGAFSEEADVRVCKLLVI